MSKNIKEDLIFFNELVQELLEEEVNNPVSSIYSPENLTKRFDLSLNFEPAIENDFREKLRDIVLNTPKSSSNLFFKRKLFLTLKILLRALMWFLPQV